MRYGEWRTWLRELPWSLKWFVVLVLIRPVIDAFWFVKHISPLLSPLNIVGVLTPVLIIVSYLSGTFPRVKTSKADWLIGLWGWLLLLNTAVSLSAGGINIDTLEIAFLLLTPIFLYMYMRHLVSSKRNMIGLLTTFMYSLIFPFALILYENLVSPISAATARGLTRYSGLFGDVSSYGVFITVGLLTVCYFFLDERLPLLTSERVRRFGATLVIGIVGLMSIGHAASMAIFAALLVLFLFHALQSGRGYVLVVGAVLVIGSVVISWDVFLTQFDALFGRELSVIESEDKGFESAFHGRGGRWLWLLSLWEELPVGAKLTGISLGYADSRWSDVLPFDYMVLKGTHNDYLRILFATGLLGLVSYIAFLMMIFAKSIRMTSDERFLVWGALAIVSMLSVSLTPTLYPTIMYICFSVFAYADHAIKNTTESVEKYVFVRPIHTVVAIQ